MNVREWYMISRPYTQLLKAGLFAEIARRPEIRHSALTLENLASFHFAKSRWAAAQEKYHVACPRMEMAGVTAGLVFQCFRKLIAAHSQQGHAAVAKQLTAQLDVKQKKVRRDWGSGGGGERGSGRGKRSWRGEREERGKRGASEKRRAREMRDR